MQKTPSYEVRADHIVILVWSRQWPEALHVYEATDNPDKLPDYVLPEIAHAYRMVGRLAEAHALYERYLTAYPTDRIAVIGYLYTLFDENRPEDIKQTIQQASEHIGQDKQLVALLMRAHAAQQDWDALVESAIFFKTTPVAGPEEEQEAMDFYRSSLQQAYDEAIRLAREGQFDDGLALLDRLRMLEFRPDQQRIDRMVIDVWRQRYQEAIDAYEQRPADLPTPNYLLTAIAQAYQAVGRPDEASALYAVTLADQSVSQDAAESPDTLMPLINTLLDAGRPEEAKELLLAQRNIEPQNPRWQSLLSVAYARLGDWDNTLRSVRDAAALGVTLTDGSAAADELRQSVTLLYDRTIEAARQGQYDDALRVMDDLNAVGCLPDKAVLDRIIIDVWRERYADAIAAYEQLPADAVRPPYLLAAVAQAYRAAGRPDDAATLYAAALSEQSEQDTDTFVQLIHTLLDAGRVVDAQELLLARRDMEPNNARWRSLLSVVHARQGQWELSLLAIQKARALPPVETAGTPGDAQAAIDDELRQSSALLYDMAMTDAQNGQYDQALRLLDQLAAAGYASPKAAADRVVIDVWRERYHEAIAAYEQLPDDAERPTYLIKAVAQAYRALGQAHKANALYQEAIDTSPHDTDLRLEAVSTAMETRQFDVAQQELDTLIQQEPDNVDFTVRKAEALWRQGRVEDALRILLDIQDPTRANQAIDQLLDELLPTLTPAQWNTIHDWLDARPSDQPLSSLEARLLIGWIARPGTTDAMTDATADRLLERLPDYTDDVIVTLADALRDRGRMDDAERCYRFVLDRSPANINAHLGYAKWLASKDRRDDAHASLREVFLQAPDNLKALFLKAELFEADEDYILALAVYERILSKYPDHQAARDLRIRALMKLGANSLAMEHIAAEERPIDPAINLQARGNRAMYRVQWQEPKTALSYIDDELALYQDLTLSSSLSTGRLGQTSVLESVEEHSLRSRWDRILALRLEQRMNELLEEYHDLRQNGYIIPTWVEEAAGDAYLYLRQPEKALEHYDAVLWKTPKSITARMARAEALSELRRFDEAEAMLDELDADLPPQVVERGILQDNWQKANVAYRRAWMLLYQDRYRDAQTYLETLAHRASFNTTIRAALAHAYLWRGWPRKAMEEFAIARAISPDQIQAAGGYASALNANARGDEARELNDRLLRKDPRNVHLQRAKREMEVEDMRTYRVDAGYVNEHPGVEETQIAMEFDQPITTNHGVFARLVRRQTAQTGDDDITERAYLGGRLRPNNLLSLRGALSFDYSGGDEFGFLVDTALTPNDYWTFRLGHERESFNIPLRSRTSGLSADETSFSAEYRSSEWFDIIGGGSFRELSDGNETWSYFVNADQLLATGPVWKPHVRAELSGLSNSRTDVSYFSPDDRWGLYLVPWVEHTWFRRYERALVDRLYGGIGFVDQSGEDSETVWFVRYEQDHRFSDTRSWLIGTMYSQNNYDGEDVNNLNVYTSVVQRW